jgi:hypothetical protein
MSFQPVLIGTGLVGWQFLKSTEETQRGTFVKSVSLARDADYFTQNISSVESAEDLVADRRLLRVALTAFGLQDDIDSRFFIKTILEDGTTKPDALANRLADDRYKEFSRAFGFDNPVGPRTQRSGFSAEIIAKYQAQQFEIAVGSQDETLRLALNFERSLPEVAASTGSADANWFKVMGTPPLRKVFETALNLPSSFGQLDIDKQLEVFRDKAQSRFGVKEIADLADPDVLPRVIQTYLLQDQVAQTSQSGAGQIALTLLATIPRTSILDRSF